MKLGEQNCPEAADNGICDMSLIVESHGTNDFISSLSESF